MLQASIQFHVLVCLGGYFVTVDLARCCGSRLARRYKLPGQRRGMHEDVAVDA